MPAYRQNPLYALYFVAFLIVNLYLFMNLMLATIYSNYRRHLKSEVQRMQQARCTSLQQCALALRPAKSAVFNDHKAMQTEASAEHSLSRMQFERLMYAYFRHWQTPLSASRDHLQPLVQLLWALLQRDQVLPESQLNALVELLNKRIALRPDTSDTQSETNSTDLPTSTAESSAESLRHLLLSVHRNLQRWVRSMHFRRFFDALILVNALLIAFDVPFLVDLECPLLILFSFELTAKLVTFGLRGFVSKYWNVFDSFVIGSAVLLSIVTECLRQYQFERSHQLPPWLLPALEGQVDTLLVLRVLRLCKLTARVPRLRLAMRTISRLLPHLALYATLLVLALYTYAVIGMQNFSGLINRQVRARNCTLTSGRTLPYCELTFDSFGSSLLLLFDLLVVNQWHVFADTYSSLAGSRLVRLYFVSFHLLCVLIVLNIFTAFVLEAFALEFASALQGEPDEHHLRRRIARMLRTGGSDCGSETAIKADAGEPNLGYEADQLDADHENVQWIRADQLHTLACQASLSTLTTTVSNASSTTITASAGSQANRAQRLQLIVRPKRSIETLLLKMFSN